MWILLTLFVYFCLCVYNLLIVFSKLHFPVSHGIKCSEKDNVRDVTVEHWPYFRESVRHDEYIQLLLTIGDHKILYQVVGLCVLHVKSRIVENNNAFTEVSELCQRAYIVFGGWIAACLTDSFKQKILSRKVIGKLICAMGSVMDASPFFTASAIKIVIPETNRPERHP